MHFCIFLSNYVLAPLGHTIKLFCLKKKYIFRQTRTLTVHETFLTADKHSFDRLFSDGTLRHIKEKNKGDSSNAFSLSLVLRAI